MGAGFLKIEELQIDEAEAKHLADAVAEVAKHYNVAVDPRTQAWANLCFAMGAVYGPRIVAYRIRTSKQKQEAQSQQNSGATIHHIRVPDGPVSATGGGAPIDF
jgi:hypothetical protein